VEAAVVFPLVILMMLALLQFGIIVLAKITITAAAHSAARSASVHADPGKPDKAAAYLLTRLRPLEGRRQNRKLTTGTATVRETRNGVAVKVKYRHHLLYPLPIDWLGPDRSSVLISSTFHFHDEISQ
jgi:Flp pilus assembly protein TadG